MARIVLVSFRLGGTDGVSIESAKWTDALRSLGHEVVWIAGEGDVDLLVPGLAINATTPPSDEELTGALEGFDLVVVENLASLPLNLGAREAVYRCVTGRKALFHHHDLPWQRSHLAHLEGPLDETGWHHVTINELSRRQLARRGIEAVTLYNSFECDPPVGDRLATRAALGVDDQLLVLLATRAIPRKNVGGALRLCERLGAVLWILGPAEDGYADELEELVTASTVDVRHAPDVARTVHDAYAASDLVVMPSTWEGFGNPVLESVTHRRPLALNRYPVAREIEEHGFEFFALEDLEALAVFLDQPDAGLFDRNLAIAREHFNLERLPARLERLLAQVGVS